MRAARVILRVAPALLLIGMLTWPMVFTSANMGGDWSLHLWYVWQQSLAIAANHEPSLFLNLEHAAFYPLFAFYGGTLYVFTGLLTLVLDGDPIVAYVATYAIAFAAAYGGWTWLARMAGLGHWIAQVPGLVYVTSGYYLTDLYGRGDWPEFLAISSVPLLVASTLSVLRALTLRLAPAIALAASALVFFGAHNITMLWGSTVLGAIAIAAAAAVPEVRRWISVRGIRRVVFIVVPAALVNSWYLLPALAYGRRTNIVQTYGYAHTLRGFDYVVALRHLFTFSRSTVSEEMGPSFVVALPVLAVAFVAGVLVISFGLRRGGEWRRALWLFSGAAVVAGVVMTHPGLVLALPAPYAFIQFGFRLETWVLLCLSAALLAALVLVSRWPRRWRALSWGLVPVVIACVFGAAQQVARHPSFFQRSPVSADYAHFHPLQPGGQELVDYADASLLVVDASHDREVDFPIKAIHDDAVAMSVALPRASLVRTNLVSGPYLIAVKGASVVGRAQDSRIVLRVDGAKGGGASVISVRRADNPAVVLGRAISCLAVLALALSLGRLLWVRLRARTAHRHGLWPR